MFQVEFTQNGETQTLGYATLFDANKAAEEILKLPATSVVTVVDATNPDDIVVVASWSRG